MGEDADQALALQTRIVGPAARVMAELDDEVREQALAAAHSALAAHQGQNGIHLDAGVWVVSAAAS